MQPVIPYLEGNEDRYLQGWNRYFFSLGITGGAGQSAQSQLRNPVGSGIIAVLERLGIRTNTASTSAITVGYQSGPAAIADLTTIGSAGRIDGRIQPGSTMIPSTTTNGAVFVPAIFQLTVTGTESQLIVTPNQEVVFTPGSAISIFDNVVAETLTVSYMWRERVMEQSELA